MKTKVLQFQKHGDENGFLVSLEGQVNIPFAIKRLFYIYKTSNNVVRGKHANKKSSFVLICVSGSCKIRIKEPNTEKVFELNSPSTGLYIPKMVWKDMFDFSDDAVLLVLSDERYDALEYIYNYVDYLNEARNGEE